MSNTSYWKASIYTKGGNALTLEKDFSGKVNNIETEIYDIQAQIDEVHNYPFVYIMIYFHMPPAVCAISGKGN